MVLQQYIQDTLFRKEPCCLPKTGIFTVRHIPARYNVTTKTLEPPQEVIKFEDTWGDEEQLINWIAQREHLVHEIARLKMDKYLQEVQNLLRTGQAFAIPGVGQLRADTQGHVTFTAEYLPIELETLMVQPVIRPNASHRVTIGDKEVVNNQVVNHLSASAENAEPKQNYEATPPDYPPYPEPESTFRWWYVAVPVAVVLAAALVWWMVAKQSGDSREQVILADREAPVDTVQQTAATVDSSMQAAAPDTGSKAYFVVIEEFHNRKQAEKSLSKQHNWGRAYVTLQQATEDTTLFRLLAPFNTPLADTTKSKDSVAVLFAKPRRNILF